MRASTSSTPTRKKSKAVPIRPLTRQKLLTESKSSSSLDLGPVTPPPHTRRRTKAYDITLVHGSIRPETAPGGSLSSSPKKRPVNRAHGPGGQGTTFLTGYEIEDDGVSILTERDPDEESVDLMSAHGFRLTPLEASK